MRKAVLLASLALILSTLACFEQLPDWEKQQKDGALTPPVTENTKYLCVIGTDPTRGALAANGNFTEIIPSGTRLIDSGRRWTITSTHAVVYYKGHALNISMELVKEC